MDPDPHLVFGLDLDPHKTDADPNTGRKSIFYQQHPYTFINILTKNV
jgi:hypothetical protein